MKTNKRIIGIAILAILVLTAWAPVKYFITGVYPNQAGTFIYTQLDFDSAAVGGVGGTVKLYQVASADTERIGNVVYLASKNTVNHSATLVNYNSLVGVVVGGTSTGMQASYSVADTSTIAGLPGKQVLVLERGRTWVLVDTGPGIAPGIGVIPSVRSNQGGRINARTTALDTFYRLLGKLVDTALAGKAALVDIRVK